MEKEIAPGGFSSDCCAFVLDGKPGTAGAGFCSAPCQPGSAYCPRHHALCHLASGSAGERRQLRAIEALATAVGGKQGRAAPQPPAPLLRRLERTARGAARPQGSASDAAPTPERRRHGLVERLERTIADATGHPARPYRAVDTLALMQRRGSISAGMRQAGEDFRSRFTVAQLDPLRALDLSHLRLGDAGTRPDRDGPGLRIETARKAVWRAVQAVGGIASPAGSCLWHVVGWECSLKEWALEQGWSGRRVSQEAASGILVAALGALEAHFGMSRSLSKSHFSVDKSRSI
jgi:hypothetical protein